MQRRRLLTAAPAALAAASLGGCAWFDAKQRGWIYRPTRGDLSQWQPVTARDEPLWLERSGARPGAAAEGVRALWIPQPVDASPAVLYLHGTFRNVFQNRSKIAAIFDAGLSVLAVEYRGWGDSSPVLPSERSIVDDAELAWQALCQRVPQACRRVLYGHSLGSGVAIELALRHRAPRGYGALVVESAFTSLPDIASAQGMAGSLAASLTTQRFASIDKIGRIDAPAWFLTGGADRTVPTAQSDRLYAAAGGPRTLERFEGGTHSRLHDEFPERYAAVWRSVATTLAETDCRPGPAAP